MSRPPCRAARLSAGRRPTSLLPSAHTPASVHPRRTITSFPASSPTPPSPLLPFFFPRKSVSRAFSTSKSVRQIERELSPNPQAAPATEEVGTTSSENSPQSTESADAPAEDASPATEPFVLPERELPPHLRPTAASIEVDATPPDPSPETATEIVPSTMSNQFSAVRTREGREILDLASRGQGALAEEQLRSLILASSGGTTIEVASADELEQLATSVLDVILYPSADAVSGALASDNVEQPDPEALTHLGTTLTRRAIRFLHFLRVHGQPRTEAMYGSLIRRILDQGHADLAARVYVELVEEWAWEQKRAAALAESADDNLAGFDAVDEDVGWLRRVQWVDPDSEDIWAFERWRRGPEAAPGDLPGQPFEQERFALFKQRREALRAERAADGKRTAADVEIEQHKRELEADAPFNGVFTGLRWNHRAEAQRRTLCWAPSPSRLRLYLRRFPPSVSRLPKSQQQTTVPFPSMTLLNPILQRAGSNLTSLSTYGAFASSVSALAIIANTVQARTLPLSHVSVLIQVFENVPQYPRVHAPLPSPDPVDDTTAYAHVQGALASLVYGLPPGNMAENVEKYGLNCISEGSANSLLSYTLTTLNSPTKGEKVLSYMRCQGYLNSPASVHATGQILIRAGLTTRVWRYFVDGLQMAVGEMASAFLRFVHERPRSEHALRLAQGSQWRPKKNPDQLMGPVPMLELAEHPLPKRLGPVPQPQHQAPIGAPSEDPQEEAAVADELFGTTPVTSSSGEATDVGFSPSDAPLSPEPQMDSGASTVEGHGTFPYPHDSELGPDFETLFENFQSGSSALDPAGAATAVLRYASAAGRHDLVMEVYRYLLGSQARPVPMTPSLYRSLILGLDRSGYARSAEQVFCLARKEQLAQGRELDIQLYVMMVQLYARKRRRGLGHYTVDGTWRKSPFVGHVYPGENAPSERVLHSGWALYRGIMWGQWQHWGPVQDEILIHNSPFTRRHWFARGPRVLPPVEVGHTSAEPNFVPPPQVNLPLLFNAAIRLLRMREGMETIPHHALQNKDVLLAMIATVSKKAINQPRSEWPPLVGLDFCLSLVAMDIKRAGYLIPLGVQLLLAKYPQHHERIDQVRPIRPISTLATDDFGSMATSDPFNVPTLQRYGTPSQRLTFDSVEMDRLGSSRHYPPGTFDDSDIEPSDWPLLVWAALEGRQESEFVLPPGLWEAAQEFKGNFALSDDGQHLLVVGRLGPPVPFIPSDHREEFIDLNAEAEARRLLGRNTASAKMWRLSDPRLNWALVKMAWWPGMRHDVKNKLRANWLARRSSAEYQDELKARVEAVVRSGARKDDDASWDDDEDFVEPEEDDTEDGRADTEDGGDSALPLPTEDGKPQAPAAEPLLPASGLRPPPIRRRTKPSSTPSSTPLPAPPTLPTTPPTLGFPPSLPTPPSVPS